MRLKFIVVVLVLNISIQVFSQQKFITISFDKTPAIEMPVGSFLKVDSLDMNSKDYKIKGCNLVLECNDCTTPVRYRPYRFDSLKYLRSDLIE